MKLLVKKEENFVGIKVWVSKSIYNFEKTNLKYIHFFMLGYGFEYKVLIKNNHKI
jgi:hypothetical protein